LTNRVGGRATAAWWLAFYLAAVLLSASGRVGSSDAGAQLDASVLVARTGRLSTVAPIGVDPTLWVRAPSGRYYQAHDLGGTALMLPAALVGERARGNERISASERPTDLTRVLSSLSFGVVAAVGCVFFAATLALLLPGRAAFPLSLLFLFGSLVWPYSKTCLDVGPACAFVSAFVYFALRIATCQASRSTFLWLGVAYGLACSFRFSLFPFLGLVATMLCLRSRRRGESLPMWLWALAPAIGLLSPSLFYNYIRTGHPLLPATTAPQFAANNAWVANPLVGAAGLLFSPSRGLLWFCPVVGACVALPLSLRQRRSADVSWFFVSLAAGLAAYVLFIGGVRNWGPFGWGPRYLVPVLPMLMLMASLGLSHLWPTRKALIAALAAASIAVNGMAVVVNWQLASAVDPSPVVQWAAFPTQHAATARALGLGLRGEPILARRAANSSHERHEFPDLLLYRVAGLRPPRSVALASACVAFLSAMALISFLRLRRRFNTDGVSPFGFHRAL
jgi:hypothetical protein